MAAAGAGRSVIVIEPSRWLGGMIGGGIRITTDCQYPNHVGGQTRELLLHERTFHVPDHWRGQYELRCMWQRLAEKHGIAVLYEHRLGEVRKQGTRIEAIELENAPPDCEGVPAPTAEQTDAATIRARVFIDASYEGDLMAGAEVSYTIGRESCTTYGESLAGVRNVRRFPGIDPYIRSGDSASDLLPGITPEPLGDFGEASRYLIPFNFRFVGALLQEQTGMPAPSADESRLPAHHRTLINRIHAAGHLAPYGASWNFRRTSLVNGTLPGLQADYPDGDWVTRSRIWRALIEHDRLYFHVLGRRLSITPEMYPDTNGWPHQLYIRMARRMCSDYVMTQHDLAHQRNAPDSVGLGYYNVDIYPCRILQLDDGTIATEGETWELVSPGPYPIAYRSIVPRSDQCTNLLVPVCVSASHVACASLRMEPTFMLLGESAGIAANLALEDDRAVQEVEINRLQRALRDAGQILEWDGEGYGPYWFNRRFEAWWEKHPQEYVANPPNPR